MNYMSAHLLRTDQLRIIIRTRGFRVSELAAQIGLEVRTLERRFGEQLQTTPKAWINEERMVLASKLLASGFSNKQAAEQLGYEHESSFCREFKRHFGCAPQEFVRRLPEPGAGKRVVFCQRIVAFC